MNRYTLVELNSVFSNDRMFVRPDGVGFWEFLKRSGISYVKKDFPFLTETKIPQVLPVFDFDYYMQLKSRGEALAYLYRGLGRALNYVGPVLDVELEFGFNDHTDRHTLWVAQQTVEILQRAGKNYDGTDQY